MSAWPRSCASCSTTRSATPPRAPPVTVSAERTNGSASLTVSDLGPGLSESTRAQAFERFFTGDATRGAGLGLAIARELAERMDGDLRLAPHSRGASLHPRSARGRGRGVRAPGGSWPPLLAIAGGGCSDDGSDGGAGRRLPARFHHAGAGGGGTRQPRAGSTPAQIYERLVPGVVTVISIFDGGGLQIGEDGAGGQGSGFVLDGRATSPRTPTWSPGRTRAPTAPTRCTWSSPTATAWRRRSSEWT